MLRLLAVLLLCLHPAMALARCEGTDLINSLAPDEHNALTARASETPFARGLLWRATRGDTTITLFGTYHFKHAQTAAHLTFVQPLIDTADAVFLEVSNDDQKKLQHEIADDPSVMFITQGDTLPDLLGADDWKRLVEEMRKRAIPGFLVARFKPFWAAMMLGIGPCEARSGAMEQGGIDKAIGDYAASIGNPSRSLEDYRTLLTLLDTFPLGDQLDMIRLSFAWSGQADDIAYTLRQRYLEQDIALIWEFSRHMSEKYGGATAAEDFALFEQELLIRRNLDWLSNLMDQPSGQTIFMAVGAAHLPGDHGMLTLLENTGFTIENLPFAP